MEDRARQRRALLAGGLASLLLAGCRPRIRSPNEIVVGSSPTGVPFSFIDPATNLFTGSMVETAEAICGGLHLSTDVRITPFSALIPSLLANKIDIIAAALLRTPEREKIVGFSDPVFHYSGALVVHREDRRPFPNLAAARDLRVGGQVGTRFIEQLREAGVTQVSTYESISDMLRDLDHGRLDAAYGDDPIIRYQLRVGPRRNAMIAEGFVAPAREELCLVLRRGDPLLPSVNTVIARLGKSVIPSINRRWGLTA